MNTRTNASGIIARLLNAALVLTNALLFCASAVCFWMSYEFYFRWDFNELGRHFDSKTDVVYTDSGFIWIFPAVVLLIAALFLLAARAGGRRKQKNP